MHVKSPLHFAGDKGEMEKFVLIFKSSALMLLMTLNIHDSNNTPSPCFKCCKSILKFVVNNKSCRVLPHTRTLYIFTTYKNKGKFQFEQQSNKRLKCKNIIDLVNITAFP